MQRVDVTWKRAAKIWWSFTWRSTLFMLGVGFCVGIFFLILGKVLNLNEKVVTEAARIATVITSIPMGMFVIKIVLGKTFSDFTIVLASPDTALTIGGSSSEEEIVPKWQEQ